MPRSLELIDARDPRVERIWRALQAQAHPTFFLSWGWIENWLATLPIDRTPELAVIHREGAPIAACFLGRRRIRRRLVLASDALYINATGFPRHDDLCAEHNQLLAPRGAGRSLAALVDVLPGTWDELFLPCIDRYAFEDLDVPSRRYRVRVDRETTAPFVDLDAVRGIDGGYLALLGASTRAQLRRARRLAGELTVEIASDERHALDIYGELLRLHARRWAAAGQRGAFADPWFERFHRRLIQHRLGHGEIQLLRVRAGDRTLGCLYNFVYGGRVLFYQSGVAMLDDPHLKPGYLCHAAAIEHNAGAGHAVYDLLGGDARYKHNLATGVARLLWVCVQRPRTRFALENRARDLRRLLSRPQLALRPARV